jgi:hypothetical protein
VVLTPEGELGLIDIADLRFCRSPLRAHLRQRNFRHLLRIKTDREWITQDGGLAFCAGYLKISAALPSDRVSSIFSA